MLAAVRTESISKQPRWGEGEKSLEAKKQTINNFSSVEKIPLDKDRTEASHLLRLDLWQKITLGIFLPVFKDHF